MKDSRLRDFLNYHHLRYFWAVARAGTLRAAAEELGVSQPSMSAQIKALEVSLDERLFRQSGRRLVLTEFGKVIFGYAEEIFSMGGEILRLARQLPTSRRLSLHVGVTDAFPKLLGFEILSPVFEHDPPVQLSCVQGKLGDLLGGLNNHRLDVVLSDEPASPSSAGKVFNHSIGTSHVTFCATAQVARKLKGRFPRNLNRAPMLLPAPSCYLRRDLEKWFRSHGLLPHGVAEFEDTALLKLFAAQGVGVIALPSMMEREAFQRFDLTPIGRTQEIEVVLYAITAERRLIHPAVSALTQALTKRSV